MADISFLPRLVVLVSLICSSNAMDMKRIKRKRLAIPCVREEQKEHQVVRNGEVSFEVLLECI